MTMMLNASSDSVPVLYSLTSVPVADGVPTTKAVTGVVVGLGLSGVTRTVGICPARSVQVMVYTPAEDREEASPVPSTRAPEPLM